MASPAASRSSRVRENGCRSIGAKVAVRAASVSTTDGAARAGVVAVERETAAVRTAAGGVVAATAAIGAATIGAATVPIGGAEAGADADTGSGASATAAARSLRSSTASTTSRFTPSSKPSATPQIGNGRRDATARTSNIAGCSWRSRAFSDLRSASRMKDIPKLMAAMRRNPPFVRSSIARSGADRHSPSHRAVR